jgi:AraC family transcriptional regulator
MNATQKHELEEPRFVNGPKMVIAGPNVRYTFETRVNIPAQWERFAPHIGTIPGQVGGATYGVCWNYDGGAFDYLSGVEVSDDSRLPDDFDVVRLAAQKYAVFTHRGHVSAIPDTIQQVWTAWLPGSGRQAAEAPCFERYSEDFNPQTGLGGMEIWIPIKQ